MADKNQSEVKIQRRKLIILWITLFTLVVADGIVTNYIVAQRFGREFNPLLISWVGNSGFLPLKAAGAALSIFILWDISKRHYRLALIASIIFVVLYCIIVFWNLFVCLLGWL